MKGEHKDLAASIRQRLFNRSAQEGNDFQLVLTRYGIERLLYRLSRSPYCDRFMLKGALLFIAWEGWSPRPTRDVDLLGHGEYSAAYLKSAFKTICQVEVVPDGLVFHPETLKVMTIRGEQEYGGHRVRLYATLAQARVDIQIDVGYGDAVFPASQWIDFPSLLNLPAPTILAYPREAVVAEKFHALATLGVANTRMKDFYDLWLLARQFAFDGKTLAGAIQATFQRRQTPLPDELPLALTATFYADHSKQVLWRAFLKRNRLPEVEASLEEAVVFVHKFLWLPTQAIRDGKPFNAFWQAGGPWTT